MIRTQVFVAAGILLCAGCPSDDEVLPAVADAATVVDAGPSIDAATPDASSCATCSEPLPICEPVSARCVQCLVSPDCAAVPFTNVCDGNSCKECAANADCTTNVQAFGPTCDQVSGVCGCSLPADCAANPNGVVCHATIGACTCETTADCSDPATCQPLSYLGPGVKTCQSP